MTVENPVGENEFFFDEDNNHSWLDIVPKNIGSKMDVELNIDKNSLSTTAPSIANIEQNQAPNYPEGKTSCIWSQNRSRQTPNLKLCV